MKRLVDKNVEIIRKHYLDKIEFYKDKDLIKVIVGIRRCGKSVILQEFYDLLVNKYKVNKTHILYMNFDDNVNEQYKNFKSLSKHIDAFIGNLKSKDKKYLLLDEIQDVEDFDKLILSLYQDKSIDIYLTGSNANLNSKQIATKFLGRDIQINIFPFNFSEFLNFHKKNNSNNYSTEHMFELFRSYGGMPLTQTFNFDWDKIKEFLNGLLGQIIIRDVSKNYPHINTNLIVRLLKYVYDTTSQTTSYNNISKNLNKLYKINLSSSLIEDYLEVLSNVFLLNKVKRYDIQGKQILKTLDKYYAIDTGLRNAIVDKKESNLPWLLESIVYNELLTRDYHVTIGKISKIERGKEIERKEYEIDFIASKGDKKIYIQVCEDITNPETRDRELRSLKLINNSFPKILIVNKPMNEILDNGIQIIGIIDFLLKFN